MREIFFQMLSIRSHFENIDYLFGLDVSYQIIVKISSESFRGSNSVSIGILSPHNKILKI